MRPLLLAAALLVAAAPVRAQDATAQDATAPPARTTYTPEHTLIESVIGTLVDVVRGVALESDGTVVGDRLQQMVTQLQRTPSSAVQLSLPLAADGAAAPDEASRVHATLAADDLRELARLLDDLFDEMRDLRADLADEQRYDLADRLLPVQRSLDEAAALAERLAAREARYAESDRDRWDDDERDEDDWREEAREAAREAREEAREAREAAREAREEAREAAREAREEARDEWDDDRDEAHDHWDDEDDRRDRWDHDVPFIDEPRRAAMIGDFPYRWPYRETAVYRNIPALRYNRVEGFVLGIGTEPLLWGDYERGKIHGQVGYAFALERWRYEVGAETFVTGRGSDDVAVKLGVLYRDNTATNDLWKSNWLENSLAAFFFENDFFDYYEVEGWNVYGAAQVGASAQVSVGFRAEDYESLTRNTTWSLFGGDGFRFNPPVEPGFMQSVLFAVEGGRVRDLTGLPRGAAFRAEAEIGEGVGGDFSFNRYVADGRVYLPINRHSALALRLRAGTATGDVPVQKGFTIGGVGSVRAYPQNAFYGTRTVVANAEYLIDEMSFFDELLDDVQVFTFADAGWTNGLGSDELELDRTLAALGVGVGLDDRALRLELAWPVGDDAFVTSRRPTLWLRLAPSF